MELTNNRTLAVFEIPACGWGREGIGKGELVRLEHHSLMRCGVVYECFAGGSAGEVTQILEAKIFALMLLIQDSQAFRHQAASKFLHRHSRIGLFWRRELVRLDSCLR